MFTESPHVWACTCVCECVWIIALNLISLSQNGASTSPMIIVTSGDSRGGATAEGGGGGATVGEAVCGRRSVFTRDGRCNALMEVGLEVKGAGLEELQSGGGSEGGRG